MTIEKLVKAIRDKDGLLIRSLLEEIVKERGRAAAEVAYWKAAGKAATEGGSDVRG